MNKIKDVQISQWKLLVPQFNKQIQTILQQIKSKPITTNEPSQYFHKKKELRNLIEQGKIVDLECEDDYFDVFFYMIEQRTNISLNDLASQFKQSFGKQNEFWANKISSWASSHHYTRSFNIWNVHEYIRSFGTYSQNPLERSQIQTWRKKISPYLISLETLTKRIQRVKKTDSPYCLDQAFKRYCKCKQQYQSLKNKSYEDRTLLDETTVSISNKFKGLNPSKLSNKFSNNNSQSVHSMIKIPNEPPKKVTLTLDMFFKTNKSNQLSNIQEVQIPTDQQQKQIQLEKFRKTIQNIGRNQPESLQKLKQHLKQQKKADLVELQIKQRMEMETQMMKSIKKSSTRIDQPIEVQMVESFENAQYKKYPLSHFTFIYDPNDYFFYQATPIGQRKQIDFSKPFQQYAWVNYQSNQMEFFQDLMAASLDGSEIMDSSQEQQDQEEEDIDIDQYFIDNRTVIDDQSQGDTIATQDRMNFAQDLIQNRKTWVADYKYLQGADILANFPLIAISGNIMPYAIEAQQKPKGKKTVIKTQNQEKFQINIQLKQSMHQILQLEQQQNSTTNYGARNKINCMKQSQKINETQYQNENEQQLINLNILNGQAQQQKQKNVLQTDQENNILINESKKYGKIEITQQKYKFNLKSSNQEDKKQQVKLSKQILKQQQNNQKISQRIQPQPLLNDQKTQKNNYQSQSQALTHYQEIDSSNALIQDENNKRSIGGQIISEISSLLNNDKQFPNSNIISSNQQSKKITRASRKRSTVQIDLLAEKDAVHRRKRIPDRPQSQNSIKSNNQNQQKTIQNQRIQVQNQSNQLKVQQNREKKLKNKNRNTQQPQLISNSQTQKSTQTRRSSRLQIKRKTGQKIIIVEINQPMQIQKQENQQKTSKISQTIIQIEYQI